MGFDRPGVLEGRRVFSCQVPITKIRPPADAKGGEGKKGMGDTRFFFVKFFEGCDACDLANRVHYDF